MFWRRQRLFRPSRLASHSMIRELNVMLRYVEAHPSRVRHQHQRPRPSLTAPRIVESSRIERGEAFVQRDHPASWRRLARRRDVVFSPWYICQPASADHRRRPEGMRRSGRRGRGRGRRIRLLPCRPVGGHWRPSEVEAGCRKDVVVVELRAAAARRRHSVSPNLSSTPFSRAGRRSVGGGREDGESVDLSGAGRPSRMRSPACT